MTHDTLLLLEGFFIGSGIAFAVSGFNNVVTGPLGTAAMSEDSMPSKRMVPEQEVAELSDEIVRLRAIREALDDLRPDSEIILLLHLLDAARAEIAALTAKLQDERQHHARQYLDSHAAAFNARWWMAERFEKWAANPEAWTPDDDVHMEFRFLRHIAEKLAREHGRVTLAALDAEAAAEAESFQCPSCHWHEGHDPEEWFREEVRLRASPSRRDQGNGGGPRK